MAQLRAFSTPAFNDTRLTSVTLPAGLITKLVGQEIDEAKSQALQEQTHQWGLELKAAFEEAHPDKAHLVKHLTIRLLPKGREAILEIAGYAPELEIEQEGESESVVAGWLKEWQDLPNIQDASIEAKQRFPETLSVTQVDMGSRTRDALISRYSTLIVGLLSFGAGLAINATARVERQREEKLQAKNSETEEKGGVLRWLKTAGSMCFMAASSILTLGGVLRAQQRSLPEMFRDIDMMTADQSLTEESAAEAIAAKDTSVGKASRFMQKGLWSIVPSLNLSGNALIMAGAASSQPDAESTGQEAAPKTLNRAIEGVGTGLGIFGNMYIATPLRELMEKFGLKNNPGANWMVNNQMTIGAGTDQFGSMLLALAPLSKIFGRKTGDKDTQPGVMDYAQVLMLPISFLCGVFTMLSPRNKEYDAESIGAEAARYLNSKHSSDAQAGTKGDGDHNMISLSDVERLSTYIISQPEILDPAQKQDITKATLQSLQTINPNVVFDDAAKALIASAEVSATQAAEVAQI